MSPAGRCVRAFTCVYVCVCVCVCMCPVADSMYSNIVPTLSFNADVVACWEDSNGKPQVHDYTNLQSTSAVSANQ